MQARSQQGVKCRASARRGLPGKRMAVNNRHQVKPLAQSPASSAASTAMNSGTLDTFDETRYRRNVGICVVNRRGLVFAAQRADSGCNSWQMPQGGVDDGEAAEDACLRELEEETCIQPTSARIVGRIDKWLTYDFPTQVRARLHNGWENYQGQAQKWFLVLFDGEDSEIDLDTEHREFKQWQWMPLEELPGSVVAFKQDVYSQVAKAFIPAIEELRRRGEISKE